MTKNIDVLMITYNRPTYTRLSLQRLLDSCDENMRVWLWHNGMHMETLEVVRSFLDHPRVYRFNHSEENKKLREPTNWMWQESDGAYLSKVDDDCLVPDNWAQLLRKAHEDVPEFGILGCWRFPEEDFDESLSRQKIFKYPGGHRILQNCWIEGSGYLMKRACVDALGLLANKQSFTQYGIELAARGWIHGWYYPFLYQEHMDDPRAVHSLLKTDEDLKGNLPLSALVTGVTTLDEWTAQLRHSAKLAQSAPINVRYHTGWRRRLRNMHRRIQRLMGKNSKRLG